MKTMNSPWKMLSSIMAAIVCLTFSSCGGDEISVSSQSISFDGTGGTQTVRVESNTNWSVTGAQDWLTVTPSFGSGNGEITISAKSNATGSTRTATLYLSGGEESTWINVKQDALDAGSEVAGEYVGTLSLNGWVGESQRCYITLTRLYGDAVRVTNILCEQHNLDLSGVNLTVSQLGGRIKLNTESRKDIEGDYIQGSLTLHFGVSNYYDNYGNYYGDASFYFSGEKN